MKTAVLIVAHGSREDSANRQFVRLVCSYRKRHPNWTVAHAFLEMASPSIPQALSALAGKSRMIKVLPFFLFAARHVKRNIPDILQNFRKSHPGLKLRLAKPLGADFKLLEILDQRAKRA